MKSIINWLVLGLVIEKPSYGYELVDRFNRRFAGFRPVSKSHVYGVLTNLEKKHLIEPITPGVAVGTERAPKLHYRATPEGARRYRLWLHGDVLDDSHEVQLLGRLVSAGALDASAMLAVIDRFEEECLKDRAGLRRVTAEEDAGDESALELADQLVGEHQRAMLHARIMWIQYARAVVSAHAARRRGEVSASGDDIALA